MNRIELLPIWTLSDGIPSVYDTTSGTYQEMVAKVYGAMRTLQLDYNSFANVVNEAITRFITDTNSDQEKFKNEINKIVHDYIVMIDTKIAHQDKVIEENIAFVKNNLASEVTKVINEMKDSGELDIIIGDAIGGLGERITDIESQLENQFIPTKTSDIENDLNFASKEYVDTEIATFDFIKVVDELPAQGLENRIYFVPKADSQTQDLFDEYAWINNKWEWITTKQIEVDLTPYYKKTETYSKGEVDTEINEINGVLSGINTTLSTIVESGSNTNGEYIKFSDGTMICTKRLNSQTTLNVWEAPIIYADISCGDFSQTFTTIQSVQATSENNQITVHSISNFTTTSAGSIRITGCASVSGERTYTLHIFAIGRWK